MFNIHLNYIVDNSPIYVFILDCVVLQNSVIKALQWCKKTWQFGHIIVILMGLFSVKMETDHSH